PSLTVELLERRAGDDVARVADRTARLTLRIADATIRDAVAVGRGALVGAASCPHPRPHGRRRQRRRPGWSAHRTNEAEPIAGAHTKANPDARKKPAPREGRVRDAVDSAIGAIENDRVHAIERRRIPPERDGTGRRRGAKSNVARHPGR